MQTKDLYCEGLKKLGCYPGLGFRVLGQLEKSRANSFFMPQISPQAVTTMLWEGSPDCVAHLLGMLLLGHRST